MKNTAGLLAILFLVCLAVPAGAEAPKLVASNFSDRYHWSNCKVAEKIRKEDLLFFNTPEEAVAAGLNPCKKCNPPISSKRSGKMI